MPEMRFYTYPTAGIAPVKPGSRVTTDQGLGIVAYAHYQELTIDLDNGTRVWLPPTKVKEVNHEPH